MVIGIWCEFFPTTDKEICVCGAVSWMLSMLSNARVVFHPFLCPVEAAVAVEGHGRLFSIVTLGASL